MSVDKTTVAKIARRMRKHKTRLLKSHRPKREETIKYLDEKNYKHDFLDKLPEDVQEEPEPLQVLL